MPLLHRTLKEARMGRTRRLMNQTSDSLRRVQPEADFRDMADFTMILIGYLCSCHPTGQVMK